MSQIGEMEILKTRIYNLDAECHCELRSTVVVEPGRYPLYRDAMTTYWVMRGKLNQRGIWRMGDGLFGLYESDSHSEVEVMFSSRRYGPAEWAELVAGPLFDEGHEDYRLRVLLSEEVAAS